MFIYRGPVPVRGTYSWAHSSTTLLSRKHVFFCFFFSLTVGRLSVYFTDLTLGIHDSLDVKTSKLAFRTRESHKEKALKCFLWVVNVRNVCRQRWGERVLKGSLKRGNKIQAKKKRERNRVEVFPQGWELSFRWLFEDCESILYGYLSFPHGCAFPTSCHLSR